MKKKDDTILLEFWSWIFGKLNYLSVFYIVRKVIPYSRKRPFIFVDIWVILNLLLSFLFFTLQSSIKIEWIKYIIVTYGIFRSFELLIYLINVMLFDFARTEKAYKVRSYRRLIISLFHNYFEIALWFASFYAFFDNKITMNIKFSYIEQFMESFKIMFTFNSDKIIPNNTFGYLLISYQIIIGLSMTILIVSRVISLLPTFKTMDKNEK